MDREVKSWPNLPSYTYATRQLTQEVARTAGRHNGEGTADRVGHPAEPPLTPSSSPLPGDPIAE